ncbi:hypothetical protein SCUCBS95973_008369 [Sporothrix curviconia]|uniref:HNH nuclease domain-containing protein n=1 Tax=Sporothrix curviconia TaxID=1260050 RepID=A0ABP0CMH9_9PEZI
MAFSAATQSDAQDRLQRFLARASTNAGDVAQLLSFLDDQPRRTPTTTALPADEVDERLSFLEHALRHLRAQTPRMELPGGVWPVNAWGLSMVFCLPLDSLRSLRPAFDSGPGAWTLTFPGLCDETSRLSNIVLQRGPRPVIHEDRSVVVGRNRAEAAKCLTRDGSRCLFLGTPMAEACHIIPYVSGNTPHRCTVLRSLVNASMALAGSDGVLLGGHPGCTDKDWNMLTLNPFLHTLWARGVFALKCLGVAALPDEAGALVTVQLHWMPTLPQRETAAPYTWEAEVNAEDLVAWLRRWESRTRHGSMASPDAGEADASTVTVSCSRSGRFIQTGHTVDITLPSMADGQRMRAMLDVQWGCIRMANMSGAAGDPEFLRDWDDDYPDANYYAPPPREDDVDDEYAEAPSWPLPDAEDAEAFSN